MLADIWLLYSNFFWFCRILLAIWLLLNMWRCVSRCISCGMLRVVKWVNRAWNIAKVFVVIVVITFWNTILKRAWLLRLNHRLAWWSFLKVSSWTLFRLVWCLLWFVWLVAAVAIISVAGCGTFEILVVLCDCCWLCSWEGLCICGIEEGGALLLWHLWWSCLLG